MLSLLVLKDDFFADFAFGGVAVLGNRVDNILHIVFRILTRRLRLIIIFKAATGSSTCKLLLSSEDFGASFSVHVQDLYAVKATHRRVPDAPARFLLLALLYTSIKETTKSKVSHGLYGIEIITYRCY